MKIRDLKDVIRDSLPSQEKPVVSESYVAEPKQYKLPTEMQSPGAKQSHFELYQGYIKSFNTISAKLDAVDRSDVSSNSSDFRSLKIDETYNMNAAYLHELYFANISDLQSEITMDSLAYMRLSRDFGTFDDWQRDFMACCQASRCGWAMTYYSFWLQRYVNCPIDLHSTSVPTGAYPVIVMDVWQHAYYRDYLRDVKTYTVAMMKELNWAVIEGRFEKAEAISKVLR
jgi:Fe-Mn family superoxide dismutase